MLKKHTKHNHRSIKPIRQKSPSRLVFQNSYLLGSACFLGTLFSAQAETLIEHPVTERRLFGDAFGGDWHDTPNLTGDWGGLLSSLEDRGLVPYAAYVGEFMDNASGGSDEGSAFGGLLDFGLEADLEKLVGWEGGSFLINAFYFKGNDVSGDHVGDFNAVSNLYTDTEFNVFNIYLRQSFDGDRLWFKGGQIAVDDDFMVSESSLLFINASFGPLPVQSGNIAAPIYSLAAPGALVYIEPVKDWYLQGAVYAGDAGPAQSDNQGFDWRTGGATGWAWFGEVGHNYDLLEGGVIKLGGYYASSEFTNFTDGNTERGLGAFYAVLDQRVLSSETSSFGMSFFLRGGVTPDDEVATVEAYLDGGVVFDNVLMDNDALGFAFSQTWFGDDYQNDARAGGDDVSSSEIVLEATYQFKVTEWFAVQPDLQYIIDPHFSMDNALVVGARAVIIF